MHAVENELLINIETHNIENIVKKRGRKRKEDSIVKTITHPSYNIMLSIDEINPISVEIDEITNHQYNTTQPEHLVKKRGRKPKGGKLTFKQPDTPLVQSSIANIILHLKCSLGDLTDYNNNLNKMVTNPLEYNPSIPLNILTYNQHDTNQFSLYEETSSRKNAKIDSIDTSINIAYSDNNTITNIENTNNRCSLCSSCKGSNNETTSSPTNDDDINMKDINMKLKNLKISLYKNQNTDTKSACFWCTYGFDNPSCYIPKYEIDGKIFGYGSFCRPECAVAFLMKENIDDSSKFERYHLLNQIYSKIYGFKKNIKPSPNPYYLLEKFYGNLSIQEYRKLLKTEHMLLVIEKPMTRVLPELHEENEDLISNIYGSSKSIIPNNTHTAGVYKVQRQSERQTGPSKSSIVRDKFGI